MLEAYHGSPGWRGDARAKHRSAATVPFPGAVVICRNRADRDARGKAREIAPYVTLATLVAKPFIWKTLR
jgi:hypothetical protein